VLNKREKLKVIMDQENECIIRQQKRGIQHCIIRKKRVLRISQFISVACMYKCNFGNRFLGDWVGDCAIPIRKFCEIVSSLIHI
jgi:hypothetical protein